VPNPEKWIPRGELAQGEPLLSPYIFASLAPRGRGIEGEGAATALVLNVTL